MISETKLHKVRELTTLREMLYQCDELFGEKTAFLAKRKKGGEYFEISFSQLFSQQVDGVKLFSIFNDISKDIRLRYAGNMIIATLPKTKDMLHLSIEVIEKAMEAKR